MNRLYNNLFTLVILASCGIALLTWLMPASTFLQVTLGLLLVLILPGYTLSEMLFRGRQLTRTERLLYVLGGSLTVATLGALALHQLPSGLHANGWMGLFGGVTLVGTLVAALKRQSPMVEQTVRLPRLRIGFNQLLLLAIAVGVGGIAIKTAQTPVPTQGLSGYTLLWLNPTTTATSSRLQLGISNQEFAPTAYKLQIKLDDQVAQEWPNLALAVNGRWEAELAVPAAELAQYKVTAELYRLDQPDVLYRHVVLRPSNEALVLQ